MVSCPGPGHQNGDRHPSLKLDIGDDGKILAKCHAGCEFEDIMSAVGVEVIDTFPDREEKEPKAEAPLGCSLERFAYLKQFDPGFLADNYVESSSYMVGGVSVESVAFSQLTKDGTLHKTKHRIREYGHNKFLGNGSDIPYGLWRPNTTGRLILCEGESDALALWSIGMPALGMPGASQSNRLQAEHCEGIESILVLGDNDEAGKKLEKSLIERLEKIGFGGEIRTMRLEESNDICDWRIQSGSSFREDFIKRCREEARVVSNDLFRVPIREKTEASMFLNPYIPSNALTMIAGMPGDGKSTLVVNLAAASSSSGKFGEFPIPKGKTLYISNEDPDHVVAGRFELAGGRRGDLIIMNEVDRHGEHSGIFLTTEGIAKIKAAIEAIGPSLIIIDPIMDYMPDKVNPNSMVDVLKVLTPLHLIAQTQSIPILCLIHFNKSQGSSYALDKIMSGRGFISKARSALMVFRDPDDLDPLAQKFILTHAKHNDTKRGESIRYEIVSHEEDESISTLNIGETCDYSADDLASRKLGIDRFALNKGIELISGYIASVGGVQWKPQTLKRILKDGGCGDIMPHVATAMGMTTEFNDGQMWFRLEIHEVASIKSAVSGFSGPSHIVRDQLNSDSIPF